MSVPSRKPLQAKFQQKTRRLSMPPCVDDDRTRWAFLITQRSGACACTSQGFLGRDLHLPERTHGASDWRLSCRQSPSANLGTELPSKGRMPSIYKPVRPGRHSSVHVHGGLGQYGWQMQIASHAGCMHPHLPHDTWTPEAAEDN